MNNIQKAARAAATLYNLMNVNSSSDAVVAQDSTCVDIYQGATLARGLRISEYPDLTCRIWFMSENGDDMVWQGTLDAALAEWASRLAQMVASD